MAESARQVIKTIGIPTLTAGTPTLDPSPDTLRSASINKVGLLYLESLAQADKISGQDPELVSMQEKHQKLLELAAFIGNLFQQNGISYAVMKTLRPFPYVGADVDVIMETPQDFSAAVKLLVEHNFDLLGHDLFSATLFRGDYNLNVDLQLEVSVSGLPYVTKAPLLAHTVNHNVNGVAIRNLDKCSEVIVIACHTFYKEHMYTLADFYITAMSVTQENWRQICALAKETGSTAVLTALLAWTQTVAWAVLQIRLPAIESALRVLDDQTFVRMLFLKPLKFPLKFSEPFVLFSLTHKIFTDKYARSSITRAVSSSFSQKQLRAIFKHFERETY